jgi:hypothetical protein
MYATLEMLYAVPLKKFMTIVAGYCRPKNSKEYSDQLLQCLTTIKATPIPKDWTIAQKDYDLHFYSRIAQHATIVKEFDEFARMGATPEELERLPRHELGSEKEVNGLGVFSIALAALGENYAQEYKRHIGEEKLKKIKNLDEFLDVFLALNDKLA